MIILPLTLPAMATERSPLMANLRGLRATPMRLRPSAALAALVRRARLQRSRGGSLPEAGVLRVVQAGPELFHVGPGVLDLAQ